MEKSSREEQSNLKKVCRVEITLGSNRIKKSGNCDMENITFHEPLQRRCVEVLWMFCSVHGGLCTFDLFKSIGTNIIWWTQNWNRNSPKRSLLHFLAILEFIRVGATTRDLFGAHWGSVRWLCHTPGAALNATQHRHHHQHQQQQVFREDGNMNANLGFTTIVCTPPTKPNHPPATIPT